MLPVFHSFPLDFKAAGLFLPSLFLRNHPFPEGESIGNIYRVTSLRLQIEIWLNIYS